jgi:hypothetical protein
MAATGTPAAAPEKRRERPKEKTAFDKIRPWEYISSRRLVLDPLQSYINNRLASGKAVLRVSSQLKLVT